MSTDDPSNTLLAHITPRPALRVISLRPQAKGSLRACEWVALPSQRYEGSDGVARFTPLVEFAPSAFEARRRFHQATLDAIHAVMAIELEADR